jgi:hypothetical protein
VDWALSYIIHTVFSVFGVEVFIRLNVLLCIWIIGIARVDSGWTRVNRGDVVKNWPEYTFAEAVVPKVGWGVTKERKST